MNNSWWILALLVNQVVGQTISKHQSSSGPKIVGGSEVNISTVPFLISLHHRNDGFLCGASIISAWWGLSALHCLEPGTNSPKNYYVRAGSSTSISGGSTHRVRKFYSYDSEFFDGEKIPAFDIVLFKVQSRFRFSNNVKPAKLPLEGSEPPKSLRVSGWGRSDMSIEASPTSVFLLTAEVTKVTWKDCISATSWYELVANETTHLCYGGEGPDACYGDSGGPLADSNTVYGIVSFGDGCGTKPGVYVKVSYFRRWIKRITKI